MKPLTEAIFGKLSEAASGQGELYAVLDAARDARIYSSTRGLAGARCLYEGEIPQPLAETAPYLVQLERGTAFTEWLLTDGWGQSWGVFLSTRASPDEVRRHLRHFLKVKDDAGRSLYFRYYDPRVLRVYLPTCNEEELKLLFGPVERFWCETEDGRSILEYQRKGPTLKRRALELPSPAERC